MKSFLKTILRKNSQNPLSGCSPGERGDPVWPAHLKHVKGKGRAEMVR